jgi:hypothetical protein
MAEAVLALEGASCISLGTQTPLPDVVVEKRRAAHIDRIGQVPKVIDRIPARLGAAGRAIARAQVRMAPVCARNRRSGQCVSLIAQLVACRPDRGVDHHDLIDGHRACGLSMMGCGPSQRTVFPSHARTSLCTYPGSSR